MPGLGAAADKVTLDGIDYYIKGPIQGEALSEFEAGFKTGSLKYDNRENAYFQTLSDFSGGFGHRRLDADEAPNTFWESDPLNAPDLSRSGHVILGWPLSIIQPTAVTQSSMAIRSPSKPAYLMPDGAYCVGFGNKIYRTTDGTTFTVVGTAGADAAELQAIVEYTENNGTIRHFACFVSGTGLSTGTARYLKSANDGLTWTNGLANYVLNDAIYWDGKIIAAIGQSITYATLTGGNETWNIDDVNDGVYITAVSRGLIHFLGVAEAPWGQPAVYFHDSSNLWVLDFYTRKCYKIDVGLAGKFIRAACQWSGNFYLSDGWNIIQYDISSRTASNIGFPRQDGIPPSMRNSDKDAVITWLEPSENTLLAIVAQYRAGFATPGVRLFHYHTGGGWSQMGIGFLAGTAFYSHAGFQGNFVDSNLHETRFFFALCAQNFTDTALYIQKWALPGAGHIPLVGTDTFSLAGANFTTGWMDGGLMEVTGALYRMFIDAWNLTATETVKVDYQLDNNEGAAWTQLVDSNGVVAVFDNTHSVLYFSSPTQGLTYRTVRFRITLNRGNTTTLSPELRALVVVFAKKPNLRVGWTFQIDVTRMVNEKLSASYAAVLAQLRATWAKNTLVPFTVPNVQTVMYVSMNKLQPLADNIRTAEAGPGPGMGSITVSVIETVAAPQ